MTTKNVRRDNPPLKRKLTRLLIVGQLVTGVFAFYALHHGLPYFALLFAAYFGFNGRAILHEFWFVPRKPLPEKTPTHPPTTIHI